MCGKGVGNGQSFEKPITYFVLVVFGLIVAVSQIPVIHF